MDWRHACSVLPVEVCTPLARSTLLVKQSDAPWSELLQECRENQPGIVDGGVDHATSQSNGKLERELHAKRASQTVSALADAACHCKGAADTTSLPHNIDRQTSRSVVGDKGDLLMQRRRPPTLDSVHSASMSWQDQSLRECFNSQASRVAFKTGRPCLQAGATQHPQQLAAASSEVASLERTAGAGESERTLAPFIRSWGDSVSQSAGDFLPPTTGTQFSVISPSAETASFACGELPTHQSLVAHEIAASWREAVQEKELAPRADDDTASSLCTSAMTILAPSLSLPGRVLGDASSVMEAEVLDGSILAANRFAEHECSHLKHGTDTPSTVPSYPARPETCSPRSLISSCSNPSFSANVDAHALYPTPQADPCHLAHVTEVCDIGQLQAEAAALQMKALNLQTWINRLAHEKCARRDTSCNCHDEAAGGA